MTEPSAAMEEALRLLHPLLQNYVLRTLNLSGPVHAWAMLRAWAGSEGDKA